MTFTSALKKLLPIREAGAHCDIPCGIYDPISAKIAAQTVQKMVLRIEALDGDDLAAQNSLSRYITVKEEHAELCKHELRVLWADYTWPGHRRQRDRGQVQRRPEAGGPVQADRQHGERRGSGCRRGRHRNRFLGHQGCGVQRPHRRGALRRLTSVRRRYAATTSMGG